MDPFIRLHLKFNACTVVYPKLTNKGSRRQYRGTKRESISASLKAPRRAGRVVKPKRSRRNVLNVKRIQSKKLHYQLNHRIA
jgi:hypothetical protein